MQALPTPDSGTLGPALRDAIPARRPARAFRPALAALPATLLAALVGTAACAPEPAPHYDDLLLADRLASSYSGSELEQLPCAAETHFGRAVRPGEVLTAELELGESPRLVLTACRRRPELDTAPPEGGGEGGDESGPGEVRVTVSAGAGSRTGAWPFDGERGWWRRELDLAALAGRRVEVKLEGAFEGQRRLFVKELVVEHATPAPAPLGPSEDGRARQLLLISIDTLRADALGALGGGGVPTPALDRLVADGEVFAPHYAGSSWTKPSHGTLLTGYGVRVHGAADFEAPIEPFVPTLAERFHDAGFATGGAVHDCVWLDPKFGFDRGFDDYRTSRWDAEPLTRAAANWMIERRDRPFFFFLHLFDAHSDFHLLPYEGAGITQESVAERFGVEGYGCRNGACASRLLIEIDEGRLAPLPREAQILRYLYDGGVGRIDRAVGGLLDDLAAAGLYDDLLIVFTSDHGEAFLEHGTLTHGDWWEEVVRVPLIVKWPHGAVPGGSGESSTHGPGGGGPSSAVDVAPTLLAAAGVGSEHLPGTDLRTRRADRPVFTTATWRMAVSGPMKLVVPFQPQATPRLFDLAADPGETRDLAAERPAELARLEALLAARTEADRELRRALHATAESGAAGSAGLSAEERARLQALGYVDAGGADLPTGGAEAEDAAGEDAEDAGASAAEPPPTGGPGG